MSPCKWLPLRAGSGEGNGTPLQYSCLENPMDGGAWKTEVHGVTEGRTRLSDFTFTFHFHALEREMATHCSVLAWRIPGTGEPGGLPSLGSHRVRRDWSDLAAAAGRFGRVYVSRTREGVRRLWLSGFRFSHQLEVRSSPQAPPTWVHLIVTSFSFFLFRSIDMNDPTPPDSHRYALYVHVFLFNVYSETNSVGLESLLSIQDLIIWNLYFFLL